MPSNGVEEPIQVTHTGGLAAFESVDGQFVYYSKGKAWVPLPSGECRRMSPTAMRLKCLSLLLIGYFNVVAHGIYFIPQAKAEAKSSIDFLSFTDGKSRKIAVIEKPVSVGLTVSHDGLVILYPSRS